MVSDNTRAEIEEHLGKVPSFIEILSDPAVDHSWGIMRDLELSETELSRREKALVGLGAAVSIQCPYCVHFHRAECEMEGLDDEEMAEAINVAGTVRYFSSAIHGAEMDLGEFKKETAEIVSYVEQQQAAPGDD